MLKEGLGPRSAKSDEEGWSLSERNLSKGRGGGGQEPWTTLRFPQPRPGALWPVAVVGYLCSAPMGLCDLGRVLPSSAGGPSAVNRGAKWAEPAQEELPSRGTSDWGVADASPANDRPWGTVNGRHTLETCRIGSPRKCIGRKGVRKERLSPQISPAPACHRHHPEWKKRQKSEEGAEAVGVHLPSRLPELIVISRASGHQGISQGQACPLGESQRAPSLVSGK